MAANLHLTLPANRLLKQLTVTVCVLCLLHIAVMVIHYKFEELPWLLRELFDLDEEQSFGTWFSTLMLLFAGVLSLLHTRNVQEFRLGWLLLGIGFCFLSLDESVGLHETLNSILDHYSWTSPAFVLVWFIGLAYIPFIGHLPSRFRRFCILGGLLYLGGALGIERATDWYAEEDLLDTLEYNLTTVVEEGMEMMGVIVFIYGLLGHIASGEKSAGVDIEVAG